MVNIYLKIDKIECKCFDSIEYRGCSVIDGFSVMRNINEIYTFSDGRNWKPLRSLIVIPGFWGRPL